MVSNSEWGPPLWRILHTLAEKIGGQTHKLLIADEERLWEQLLVQLETVLPCSLCKKHYRERRKGFSLDGLHGQRLREESRRWLWTLHETVNKEREVTSGITLEQLPALYGGRRAADIQADLNSFLEVLQRGMQAGLVDGVAVRTWKTTLSHLRALL